VASVAPVAEQGAAGAGNEAGARLYRTYCATCHGTSGRGDGPMADQLRTPPSDLTKFAAQNKGVFPIERVRAIVDGRGVRAHGADEMPVWGDAFRSAPEGLTPQAAQARIDAIVRYLQSIQERSAQRAPTGSLTAAD
jgi:mono/diheme cytochrome c family protein